MCHNLPVAKQLILSRLQRLWQICHIFSQKQFVFSGSGDTLVLAPSMILAISSYRLPLMYKEKYGSSDIWSDYPCSG